MNQAMKSAKTNKSPRAKLESLKVKTNIKAGALQLGGIRVNRCETLRRDETQAGTARRAG